MATRQLTLGKNEKLCGLTAINRLFDRKAAGNESALAYPLRAVWRPREDKNTIPERGVPHTPSRFLISVPKKRLHHAVDRVKMRRRIREAYRLNRLSQATGADIAFIYVASGLTTYAEVEHAMIRILHRIAATLNPSIEP